jgi:hypothetical protein
MVGTIDSSQWGVRGARDGGTGGAWVRRGGWRRVGRGLAFENIRCTIPGGTVGVLGIMVTPYHLEHWWGWFDAE